MNASETTKQHQIHIFGASGSGCSSLGQALAEKLELSFFDADDYYWQKTEPPFILKNSPEHRVKHLLSDISETEGWIISGSLVSWGDAFVPLFSKAIFLSLPAEIRLERLRQREKQRFGERIEKGGDRYEASQAFLDWAALYDTAGKNIRSLAMHEAWIKKLPCKVIRLQSLKPVPDIVNNIIQQLA